MRAPMNCQLIGRWRIVEADLWDGDYLDLVEPATMTIRADGHGEIAFGAVQAGLDLEYSRSAVFFTWAGFDEMDEVAGSGSAELQDDGSLEIEFAYHLGDEAVLKAVRASSSPACLSCSLSRVRARLFVSAGAEGAGSGVRTAGDRIRRRRFNKLSCAGWLPHDRGFVSELPRSRSERRLRPAHNRSRGFPTAILSPAARTIGFAGVDPLSPLSADGLIRRAAAAARSGQSPR